MILSMMLEILGAIKSESCSQLVSEEMSNSNKGSNMSAVTLTNCTTYKNSVGLRVRPSFLTN